MKVEYVTNDGLVYEAIFRHFRNAFVDHVRQSLTLHYAANADEQIAGIFGADWDVVVAKSELGSVNGFQETRRDNFDYLDVAYFGRVVDHYHDILVPDVFLGPLAKASKKTLDDWLQEIRNIRNPTAHPGDEVMDARSATRGVGTAMRVLERLKTISGIDELEELMRELEKRTTRPEEIGSISPLDDSLPPPESVVVEFVGRSSEMKQLRAWLRLPSRNRWMLVGDGGKGKTAIALTFALEVLEAAPVGLCAVFWLSAKRRKYEVDRILDIPSPDFANLSECLDQLLVNYGYQEAVDLPMDARRGAVLDLLNQLPCLLVVDDLDSVSEDNEDVIEFLTIDAAATESKILFTSRRRFTGLGSTLTVVSGLSEIESLEFISNIWNEENSLDDSLLNLADRKRIAEICEGSPLYIGDLLRLVAAALKEGSTVRQAIRDWSGVQGEIVRKYALEREMEMLTRPARVVLEALAVVARPATVQEITVLTGMSDDLVLSASEELRQLYLLAARSLDEETPRFRINGNLAILVRTELLGTPREHKLREKLASIEGKEPSPGVAGRIRDLSRQARLLLNSGKVARGREIVKKGDTGSSRECSLVCALGIYL